MVPLKEVRQRQVFILFLFIVKKKEKKENLIQMIKNKKIKKQNAHNITKRLIYESQKSNSK